MRRDGCGRFVGGFGDDEIIVGGGATAAAAAAAIVVVGHGEVVSKLKCDADVSHMMM